MKNFFVSTILMMSAVSAHGGEIRPAKPQVKGMNEKVTIRHLETNWGYEFQMNGFYQGIGRINLVPVTREAAQVLQSLHKQSQYSCVLLNSTFVPESKGEQMTGGTYFILDINCD